MMEAPFKCKEGQKRTCVSILGVSAAKRFAMVLFSFRFASLLQPRTQNAWCSNPLNQRLLTILVDEFLA